MAGYKIEDGDNWLAGIGEQEDVYIHLSKLGHLTVEKAQSAIDATYGKNYARLHDHGSVIWGTHLVNAAKKVAAKLEASRSQS